MKNILLALSTATILTLTGCSLFESAKTPLQSTPGNHIKAQQSTNGYSLDWLDQQNSTYSNLSVTVNSNGMSTFNATGVTHVMDPGVITMSGNSYLATLNAQYAAQQATLSQVLNFISSPAAAAMFAARAPTINTNKP